MKKAVLLIMLILLLSARPFKASALEQNPDGAAPPESPVSQNSPPYPEGEDDNFSTTYERELLSRRFFQKTLAPLSRREKIAWAFKTSQAGILL